MKLHELIKEKEERKRRLSSALENLKKQILQFHPDRIILFGSLTNNSYDFDSRLDILIVMPSTKTGKEWMKVIHESIQLTVASDILIFNNREFHEQVKSSRFLRNIHQNGLVIYEKR